MNIVRRGDSMFGAACAPHVASQNTMQEKLSAPLLIIGSIAGGTGVALGAFGAHGLKNTLSPDMLIVFETAVRYQMYHAVALIATGMLIRLSREFDPQTLRFAGWSFIAGIVFFSGSLYLLVLSGQHWLGAITPLGGLAFIIGWILLGWTYIRKH